MNIEQANTEATERMMEARPVLVGLGKARDVIPDMRDNLLLHAGPPLTLRGQHQGKAWERATGPMQGAITGVLIFEGKATNEAEAQALVEYYGTPTVKKNISGLGSVTSLGNP